MTEEMRVLLADARRNASAARDLLDRGDSDDIAASRAYYAMFYVAEAALLSLDLSYSKHQAVVSAFGREFAKGGILPRELHGHLREAFGLRQTADYATGASVSRAAAEEVVDRAEQFIDAIEDYLRQQTE
ncbi:MAG: HEPN domain-containing protein [Armatimonadota bacterium]|nr:HEPN domain-containing protein [Armatimonadota bacterium]